MKRIFTLLMVGLTAFFVSCDSGDSDTGGSEWFSTPESTVVGTTVELRCATKFGPGVLTGSNAGFLYAVVSDEGMGAFETVPASSVDGSTLSATLSGLQEETFYVVYAYADLGTGRMQSAGSAFRTGQSETLPEPDPERPTFGTPSALNVTASAATLSCGFTFERPTSEYTLRFEYRKAAEGSYAQKSVASGSGTKTATLTGLSASTTYEFRLCAEWAGESYTSATGRFTTLASQGGGDGGDTPAGPTKYSGWPELPVEVSNSDYYYAYHICPDFRVNGHLARNYTVCFSAEHHCPVWVAAPRHDCYEHGVDRTDAYRSDPDIPSNIQYYSDATGGGCNKGHMLGSAEREVTSAVNRQVFYYTNIAPQYSTNFNTGGGAWNNLESFVDGQVSKNTQGSNDTTYVVIGTYFKPFTDAYGKSCLPATISFGGRSDVTRPSMFYYLILRSKSGTTGKSVYDLSASELKCAAFVLRHNMEKGHTPQAKDMRSVKEIEELTGFTFFANVPNAPKDTYNPSDWGL